METNREGIKITFEKAKLISDLVIEDKRLKGILAGMIHLYPVFEDAKR